MIRVNLTFIVPTDKLIAVLELVRDLIQTIGAHLNVFSILDITDVEDKSGLA